MDWALLGFGLYKLKVVFHAPLAPQAPDPYVLISTKSIQEDMLSTLKQEKSARVENIIRKLPHNMKPSISIQRGHIMTEVNFHNYTLNNIIINN